MKPTEKKINMDTVEIENVDMKDYPKFCDAMITYAEWMDGTPLTEQEMEDAYGIAQQVALENYP